MKKKQKKQRHVLVHDPLLCDDLDAVDEVVDPSAFILGSSEQLELKAAKGDLQ